MPYINSDGSIVEKRSNFRLSIITDFFWAILNMIGLFFDTLINPTKKQPKMRKRDEDIARKRASGDPAYRGARGNNIKSMPKASEACTSGG